MTDSEVKPSSPTTEAERPATPAGRQLWHALVMMVRGIQKDELAHDIRAIEQQARDEARREVVREIERKCITVLSHGHDLEKPGIRTALFILSEVGGLAGLNASEPQEPTDD